MSNDHTYIASVVALYWFVSIGMVYINKVLMSSDSVSISAPFFITFFQCLITAIICYAAGEVGENSRKAYKAIDTDEGGESSISDHKPPFLSQFPKAEFKTSTAQRVFPLSIVFVGMIASNNFCLKLVEVSFYNVARSLTIVFNVIFTNILLGSSTSPRTLACLGIVIFGFFLGSKGEVNFSLAGTIAGVLSSLFVSLNSIFTKKVLPAVDNDHWRLTFYNNINAMILFIPLILIFEHEQLYAAFSGKFFSGLFWSAMLLAGFLGFSIGIVTVLQIKATSPLSHNISGTAKAAVQSILALYIWKNEWTFMGIVGIFTVLGGSLLYTLVKMNENKKPSMPASLLPKDANNKDIEMQIDTDKSSKALRSRIN